MKNKPTYEALYKKHYKSVVTFCKNKGVANPEDTAQETFVNIYNSYPSLRFDHDKEITAWIFTIARNLVIDRYRKYVNKTYNNYCLPVIYADCNVATKANAIQNMTIHPVKNAIQKAIKPMSFKKRVLYRLRFEFDMKYIEISAYTGIPLGTVKGNLNRIKKELQAALTPLYREVVSR